MDSQEPSTVEWRVWVHRHAPHLLLFARQQTRCEAGAETFFRKRSRAAQDAESAPDMNETDTEFTLFERQLREFRPARPSEELMARLDNRRDAAPSRRRIELGPDAPTGRAEGDYRNRIRQEPGHDRWPAWKGDHVRHDPRAVGWHVPRAIVGSHHFRLERRRCPQAGASEPRRDTHREVAWKENSSTARLRAKPGVRLIFNKVSLARNFPRYLRH